MKQKIIETYKARLLIVDLPEGAERIHINENRRISFMTPTSLHFIEMKEKLPPGNWKLLGKPEDVSWQDAGKIVEGNHGSYADTMWMDYSLPKGHFMCFQKHTTNDSLQSLIESEISLVNPMGEKPELPIDPLEGNAVFPSQEDMLKNEKYLNDMVAWQAAEERVFKNPVLLIELR